MLKMNLINCFKIKLRNNYCNYTIANNYNFHLNNRLNKRKKTQLPLN